MFEFTIEILGLIARLQYVAQFIFSGSLCLLFICILESKRRKNG